MTRQKIDEAGFLSAVQDPAYREALRVLLTEFARLGLQHKWGVGGVSVRIATPDRAEPLSIAWLFTPNARGWYGLRDLTLGVDPWSAELTPSVLPALARYLTDVARLPGAQVVTTKGMRAYHFPPLITIRHRTEILATVADFVRRMRETIPSLHEEQPLPSPLQGAQGVESEREQYQADEHAPETNLRALKVLQRLGTEQFHEEGRELGFDLLQFWRWCSSDLVNNTMRGVLAEYLVASDLGVADGTRIEWDAYDLKTQNGIKIEVKSAAYLQSWQQTRLSPISFGIQPTIGWDGSTNEYSTERKRQADVYVFAVLKHRDKQTLDPLNVQQWDFYVLPTRTLDAKVADQRTLSLSRLLALHPIKASFGQIAKAIDATMTTSSGT